MKANSKLQTKTTAILTFDSALSALEKMMQVPSDICEESLLRVIELGRTAGIKLTIRRMRFNQSAQTQAMPPKPTKDLINEVFKAADTFSEQFN